MGWCCLVEADKLCTLARPSTACRALEFAPVPLGIVPTGCKARSRVNPHSVRRLALKEAGRNTLGNACPLTR